MKADYEIGINESFKIEFVSNPSTGYSWKWINKPGNSIVDTIDYQFIPGNPDMVGSSGKEIWKFSGKRSGTEVIRLEYNRSWEPNSTIDSKTITIKVK
jgi:predicted secreted protein